MIFVNRVKFLAALTLIFLLLPSKGLSNPGENLLNLMPMPEKVLVHEGKLRVTETFTSAIEALPGIKTHRAVRAVRRMLNRLAGRTGLFFADNDIQIKSKPLNATLQVSFQRTGKLKLHEDESYQLSVKPEKIELKGVTDIGVIRGLETLLQLLNADKEDYFLPAVTIRDRPRFPWRGLLIDPCRHFMPVEVIKRNLDGMAAVKMNVLHWHLSEDQGFRVECKTFPGLHQLGSDGLYYTHQQIRDVIAYAADRGIRVMPEFDIPGHSSSWLVGYPELASLPGPYQIEREYGVKDPTFNPTIKATYKFFNKFFKEMAALFPDDYFHIGGDENNGKQWNANPKIQAFKRKHNLSDNHALQAYFNRKILEILTKYKKKMVGWDEIFQPGLPTTIVIQSWRGKNALQEAAKKGYNSILSNGYYIDLVQPTDFHYLNDPIPGDSGLTAGEKKRVLGGEATMWAELISPETIDSRIWPRTAAIAERFWSPAHVKDVKNMYRRLDIISLQLEELGLTHLKNQEMMLRRLVNGRDTQALKVLVDVVEPLKIYERRQQATYTFFSPLTRVVDASLPDAKKARVFRQRVEDFVKGNVNKEAAKVLIGDLELWKDNHQILKPIIERSPVLKEIEPLSENLSRIAVVGLECIRMILAGHKAASRWVEEAKGILAEAKKSSGHAELMVVTAIERLVNFIDPDGWPSP
ncbi:MAG: family 20 glycosylhydrolase [Candidatus Aminicenantes bacterium]|nr:MAG: family 20 glycosylhydrolase [Candidatus Aminicenantes bacterium]